MKRFAAFAAMLLAGLSSAALAQSVDAFKTYVAKDGSIALPTNYRGSWEYLGTFAGLADDKNGSHEMHVVYASPGTIKAYQATGKYPDGTVLVKEVLATGTDDLTTGRISWATDIKGWFVMVRDDQDRFKDNKIWGDGWGWMFYVNGATPQATTTDYKGECLDCHEPVRGTQLSYIQGYSPLKKP